jgi:outer membrane protein assembly factor BamB
MQGANGYHDTMGTRRKRSKPRPRTSTRVPRGALSVPGSRRRRSHGPLVLGVIGLVFALLLGLAFYRAFVEGRAEPAPEPGTDAGAPDLTIDQDIRLAYPTYLGTPQRRSGGMGPAPERLDVIWKLQIGTGLTARKSDDKLVTWSGTGWTGQPTLVYENGRPWLLIGGYDHGLRRIDAASGTAVWRAQLDDVIKGTNTVYYEPTRPADDRLVVVTGSRRGNGLDVGDPGIAPLRAFSFATGEELWRLPVARTENYSQDVDASPLRVDGRLIVALEPGYVLALDTASLSPGPGGHPMPSVVASSPLLYTPEDVTAHAENGGSNLALEGSPAVLGDRIYIASSSGHVYGLNRDTLAIEWDFAPGGDFDSTVVVTPDGYLLVGMERQYVAHGGVFKLDPRKPPEEAVVWFFGTEDRGIAEWAGGVIGSVAISTEPSATPLAAFCSVDGNVYAVNRDVTEGDGPGPDGVTRYPRPKLLFRDSIGGSISTPVIVDDRMVVAGLDTTVRLYDIAPAADGVSIAERARFTAEGPFESTPLVWDGRVYIGCRDGYLYCLGQ